MAIKTKSDRGPAGTLTVDDLTRAIKNSIDRTGMKEEEARAMAQHVLNFFGYSERIIDNVLEPEDRDAFYMLEDSGILTTEREETTLYDGREWRIHYWMFRKERIAELVEGTQRLGGERVGEDRAVGRVARHEERDRQSQGVGLGRHEHAGEAFEDRAVERVLVRFPGAAGGTRLAEELREALLLDDEPGVQPAQLEGDPPIDPPRAFHEAIRGRSPWKNFPPHEAFARACPLRLPIPRRLRRRRPSNRSDEAISSSRLRGSRRTSARRGSARARRGRGSSNAS